MHVYCASCWCYLPLHLQSKMKRGMGDTNANCNAHSKKKKISTKLTICAALHVLHAHAHMYIIQHRSPHTIFKQPAAPHTFYTWQTMNMKIKLTTTHTQKKTAYSFHCHCTWSCRIFARIHQALSIECIKCTSLRENSFYMYIFDVRVCVAYMSEEEYNEMLPVYSHPPSIRPHTLYTKQVLGYNSNTLWDKRFGGINLQFKCPSRIVWQSISNSATAVRRRLTTNEPEQLQGCQSATFSRYVSRVGGCRARFFYLFLLLYKYVLFYSVILSFSFVAQQNFI